MRKFLGLLAFLLATASEDRLSFRRNSHTSLAAASDLPNNRDLS
jgi:hypothetical protein